jgi:hypothetical protein
LIEAEITDKYDPDLIREMMQQQRRNSVGKYNESHNDFILQQLAQVMERLQCMDLKITELQMQHRINGIATEHEENGDRYYDINDDVSLTTTAMTENLDSLREETLAECMSRPALSTQSLSAEQLLQELLDHDENTK